MYFDSEEEEDIDIASPKYWDEAKKVVVEGAVRDFPLAIVEDNKITYFK
jgi:hypothetical protein